MATDRVLRDFTKAAILLTTVLLVSSTATEEMVGTTEDGTFSVSVHVRVPVTVFPEKVTQLMVQTPEVALVIWLASDSGGVQLYEAPTPVAIVPDSLPKEYSNVCVREDV